MKVWRAREGEGKEDEEDWDLLPQLPFDFYQTIEQQDVNKVAKSDYIRTQSKQSVALYTQ